MNASTAVQMQQTLQDHIQLTRAMQLAETDYDGGRLALSAPLSPNVKGSAFGGSLYNIDVRCGWSLLHLKLNEAGLEKKNIVIQEADIRHLLPSDQDMQAKCTLDEAAFRRFMRTLEKHDRARLALNIVITQTASPKSNLRAATSYTDNHA